MGRDVAPGQPEPVRRSTEEYINALDVLENALYQPLHGILQPDAISVTPKPIFEVIGAALEPIKRFFQAELAFCWVEGRDGSLHPVPTSKTMESALPYLHLAVQASLATEQLLIRNNQRVGALIVVPMHIGKQMRCALTLTRANGQAFNVVDRTAIKMIANRLRHAIATGLAWRNAHDQAQYWQTIINSIPEIIIVRDAKRKIVFYNDGALDAAANTQEIRAARKHGLPEPPPTWDTYLPNKKKLPPEEVPSTRATNERMTVLGAQLELTIYPENTEPHMVSVLTTSVPLKNSMGELMRTVTIGQDMSATKRIESMKELFITQVRHDINGPLTSTKIAVDLIERNCRKYSTEQTVLTHEQLAKFLEYVQTVRQGCVAISGLTASLNKINEAISSAPIRISLVEFVEEQLLDFRMRYPHLHFPCDVTSVDTLLEGYWCQDHLKVIFHNLMENAVKYSPGADTISINLFADVYDEKHMAHLVIIDQGIGIDKNDADLIFKKEMRANPVDGEGRPIDGTGIGLYLCEYYTKFYNGRIFVKSEGKGKGSEFHVRLPLAQ